MSRDGIDDSRRRERKKRNERDGDDASENKGIAGMMIARAEREAAHICPVGGPYIVQRYALVN